MVFQGITRSRPPVTIESPVASRGSRDEPRRTETLIYLGLFVSAAIAFWLTASAGAGGGPAFQTMAIAGSATCGWSWLLVRALFRPARDPWGVWPLALVLVLVASEAVLRLSGGERGGVARAIGNVGGLVSSTLLLLAAIEPLIGLRRDTPKAERRFRLLFAAAYAAILVVAVIWVDGAPAGSAPARFGPQIKSACALAAVAGMGLAVWFRWGHPSGAQRKSDEGLRALAERLTALMSDEAIYRRTDLRVADLGRRLGEPDYRITQCITGVLGFDNANQMINHFRIEDARRRLADPALDRLPILTVAYDCGFGSIGPFNRAFKTQTGLTPRAFRRRRAA